MIDHEPESATRALYQRPGPWASVHVDVSRDTADTGKRIDPAAGDRTEGGVTMTGRDAEQWRDEQELPLAELSEAMAVYSADGQVDDATGGDAGAEETFGERPLLFEADGEPEPDPDSAAGRAVRPSPDGRTGPV